MKGVIRKVRNPGKPALPQDAVRARVLAIPGWGMSPRDWRPLLQHLPNTECLVYCPPSTTISWDSYLENLDSSIRRECSGLQIAEGFHVIGYSWGGALAATWAPHTSIPVRSLTLLSTGSPGALPGGPTLWHDVGCMFLPSVEAKVSAQKRILYGPATTQRGLQPGDSPSTKASVARKRASLPQGVSFLLRSWNQEDDLALARLDCPKLVLHGLHDRVFRADTTEAWSRPWRTDMRVRDGGHGLLWEEPEWVLTHFRRVTRPELD